MSDPLTNMARLTAKLVDDSLTLEEISTLEAITNGNEGNIDHLVNSVLTHFLLTEFYGAVRKEKERAKVFSLRLMKETGEGIFSREQKRAQETSASLTVISGREPAEGATVPETEIPWDELIQIQRTSKSLAQMSPEEVASYRSTMAAQAEPKPQPTGKINDDYDPFFIYREEERIAREVLAQKRAERRERKRWKVSDYFFVGCIIMVFVLAGAVVWENQLQKERRFRLENPVSTLNCTAQITEMIAPVWSSDSPTYQRGETLDSGAINLDSGLVKLEFASGAKIILEGPVRFTVNKDLDTFCDQGKLSATVPASASGFSVMTPLGTVVDRGTEFFLKVENNSLDVETEKGLVELSGEDGMVTALHKGTAARLEREKKPSVFRVSSSQFFSSENFHKELESFVTRQKKIKAKQDRVLNSLPGLLVRFDMTNGNTGTLTNLSKNGHSQCASMQLEQCEVVDGPLFGMKAVSFGNRASRGEVDFSPLASEIQVLKLTATVRMGKESNNANVLFASNDFFVKTGTILWQVLNDGRVQLHVTPSDKTKELTAYTTPVVIPGSLRNTWQILSVELDVQRQEIRHYVNDELVETIPWQSPVPPVLGRATVGNYLGTASGFNGRNFSGDIAEFRVNVR
ncbi:MAG: hypothetical protein Q4G68_03575 [Planctomycetia bacterium]|nr:hypothetical protein [Planctomycetia bacterium]